MSKLLLLTKINLLTFFNLGKIINAKDKKEMKKGIGKFIIIIFGLFVLSFSLYEMVKETMPIYISFNTPYIVLAQYFAITSIFILFTNLFKINGLLFNFKDYDLLMSMPITKRVIIISKLILLYISNIIYTLIFMLPVYIVYIKYVNVSLLFHLFFWITLLIIPLVPIIIATIIGSLLTIISSKFRLKNAVNTILSIVLLVSVMYFSSYTENATSLDIANLGNSMVNVFNKIYPLTKLYLNILNDYHILSLVLFILIPVFLFTIYTYIINNYYDRINSNLSKKYTKSNYKIRNNHVKSPLMALYKKEIKRYLSSYNYVLNTAIGSIMLTISIIFFVFSKNGAIDQFFGIPGFSNTFSKYAPLVLGGFCLLNCSTHSSISLEGKNIWIIKTLPVDEMKIFFSKAMVNMTILIPAIVINASILAIYLKVRFITYLLMLVTPIIYSIFISLLGIFINLCFPVLDWTNEIRVIKQSMSSFICLFTGMILAFVPFIIKVKLNANLYTLIITCCMIILTIIVYILLNTVGKRKFKEL